MGAGTPQPLICTTAGVRMKQLYGLAGDARGVPLGGARSPVRRGTKSCAQCRQRGMGWPSPAAGPRAASARAPQLPMAGRPKRWVLTLRNPRVAHVAVGKGHPRGTCCTGAGGPLDRGKAQ